MSKITKLSDIEIYVKALELARKIYALTRNVKLKRDYSLIDQLRRASLSIPANIAEGYGRKSKRDFSQFLSISLGSVNEVITFLDFASLEYKIDTESIKESYNLLAKRIYTFRSYLLQSHNPQPITHNP